jgi:benzylsuccinate CoA-transferase BbsF subunit
MIFRRRSKSAKARNADRIGNYPDQIVSIFAAGVVIAAVIDRRRTQEAGHLDISQRELASFLIGEVIMSEQFPRLGNNDPVVPLQGCFKTMDGVWIAVRAKNLAPLELLSGLKSRDLEAFREWTARHSISDVIRELAVVGIQGVRVADATIVHEAITTGAKRSAFTRDPGGEWVKGFPFQFRSNPMQISRPAPSLSEHTREILSEVLNLSGDEIVRLDQSGITGAQPW